MTIADTKTEDPSKSSPMKVRKFSEEYWIQNPNGVVRCSAHSSQTGRRCCKPALAGATVCRSHGGAAKHVRNAARIRLVNAADRMARELLKMALDDNVSDSVKLTAIRDALDRAGLAAKTEIEISAKPYEMIFETLEGGKRDEYRKMLGIETAAEATGADLARYVGMEVQDDESDLVVEAEIDYLIPNDDPQSITPADYENGSAFDSELAPSPFAPTAPVTPGTALVPYDEAVHAAAVLRTAYRR